MNVKLRGFFQCAIITVAKGVIYIHAHVQTSRRHNNQKPIYNKELEKQLKVYTVQTYHLMGVFFICLLNTTTSCSSYRNLEDGEAKHSPGEGSARPQASPGFSSRLLKPRQTAWGGLGTRLEKVCVGYRLSLVTAQKAAPNVG